MKILLVEDDVRTAEFIIKGLRQAGYIIDHVDRGDDGFTKAINETYDAAILDVMLPGMDGLTIVTKLRSRQNNMPIIILSAKKEVDDRIFGLQAGADDYLVKPFAFSELLARIQTITRRNQPDINSRYINIGDLCIDIISRKVTRDEKRIDLQPREYTLLEYLARHKGRVVSKIMIMENVWEFNFDPQTNIVESRICRLREKVDKGFDQKLIHTVRGVGYVLDSE
jgi:two-component system, OmpR family, response regulator